MRARLVTSVASEPKRPASASGGGATGWPDLSWRVHSAMRSIGRVTDQRTVSHVMPVTSSISTPMRTAVRRHRSHSLASSGSASTSTAAAPTTWYSCCRGTTCTKRVRPETGSKPRVVALRRMASLTSGEMRPSPRRTSGVASIGEPNAS